MVATVETAHVCIPFPFPLIMTLAIHLHAADSMLAGEAQMPMHPPFPSSRSCTSTHVCHLHAAHSVVAQHHRLRGGIQIRGQGRAPLLKLGQRVKLHVRRGR